MTHHTTLRSWMQQEFSTFIAHEKAQDNYLLDQMRESLEDSESEDLESTSLISADVINQLHSYVQNELNQDVSEDHTPHDASSQAFSSQMMGDTSAQEYLGDEENTPITKSMMDDTAGILIEDSMLDRALDQELTTPISPAQLARVEQLASSLDPVSYTHLTLPTTPYV